MPFSGETFQCTEGRFTVNFVVPKNSSYKYQKGKILAYAFDKENLVDASGASTNILLGGTGQMAEDTKAPTISLYLNEASFRSGGTVGTNSLLIAKVFDENGITLSTNGFEQGNFSFPEWRRTDPDQRILYSRS